MLSLVFMSWNVSLEKKNDQYCVLLFINLIKIRPLFGIKGDNMSQALFSATRRLVHSMYNID